MNFKLKSVSAKYFESILFGFVWLLFFLSPFFLQTGNSTFDWNRLFELWWRFSPFFIFSIINHFILIPHLFYKRKLYYFLSVVTLLVILSLSLSVIHLPQNRNNRVLNNRFNQEQLFNPEGRPIQPLQGRKEPLRNPPGVLPLPPKNKPGDLPPWINSLVIAILVLGFDIGLRTTFKWNKLEKERELADKERVKSELAFLRNQLSPHFFMNTLNNIHSLIDIDTEEAKESIIRLSKLMRHLLYDSERETILLNKEISFIQSYIDLMKLRFTEKVKVNFDVYSNAPNINVPPLLFTSLIENAFKYGVSYQQDSFVDIQLRTTENELNFRIINSKTATPNKDESTSGIGLENTRKRLDLIYHSNYKMDINETVDTFSVELKLPL